MIIDYKTGGSVDMRAIRRLNRTHTILVGHLGGLEHPGKDGAPGVENATLAKWLHDGTANIPARPYLLQGMRAGAREITKAIKAHFLAVVKGKDGLDRIGATAVAAVQEFVRGDFYKANLPNSPSTIRRKKDGDTPLIDTSFLINSLTFKKVVGTPPKGEKSEPLIEAKS